MATLANHHHYATPFPVCHLPCMPPACPIAHLPISTCPDPLTHVRTPPCVPAATDTLQPPLTCPQPQSTTSGPHLPALATTFTSWLPPMRPSPHQCTLAPTFRPARTDAKFALTLSKSYATLPHAPPLLSHFQKAPTHSAPVLICKSNCNCNNNSNQKLDIEGMLS